ncbi:MAG: aspartate dehydrogenase [Tissierellia bacterium]|nr:aspartate dehydrogenase [Tissierellia bacterium]
MKKKIAVIGYGALSKVFLSLFKEHLADDYEINGILIKNEEKRREAEKNDYKTYKTLEELLLHNPDYVAEFASASAIKEYAIGILNKGINLIIISVGALEDNNFYEKIQTAAKKSGSKIHIASGAIGGFDLMRTFSLDSNAVAKIQTTKSPESWEGAPYLENKTLSKIESEIVFQGNAKEAIKGFPKNVNVAVATSIAVSGVEDTQVELISDSNFKDNTHKIFLESKVAKATIEITAKKDLNNPKSSVITAWSVVALLKNINDVVMFF